MKRLLVILVAVLAPTFVFARAPDAAVTQPHVAGDPAQRNAQGADAHGRAS